MNIFNIFLSVCHGGGVSSGGQGSSNEMTKYYDKEKSEGLTKFEASALTTYESLKEIEKMGNSAYTNAKKEGADSKTLNTLKSFNNKIGDAITDLEKYGPDSQSIRTSRGLVTGDDIYSKDLEIIQRAMQKYI